MEDTIIKKYRASSRCVTIEGNEAKNKFFQRKVTRRGHLSFILLYALLAINSFVHYHLNDLKLPAPRAYSYTHLSGRFESFIIYLPAASGSSQANDTASPGPGSRRRTQSPRLHVKSAVYIPTKALCTSTMKM